MIFRILDGKLEISPLPMTLEQAAGSVSALNPPLDYSEMRRIAREDHLESQMRKGIA